MLGIIAALTQIGEIVATIAVTIEALKVVVNGIVAIGKALGIVDPQMDAEELGTRALQAEEMGITPEQFDSYDEYIKRIQDDDWGFDPEKQRDPKEALQKATEIVSGAAIENLGEKAGEFIRLAGTMSKFFTPERIGALTELFVKDKSDVAKVTDYLSGKEMTSEDMRAAYNTLSTAEKATHPAMKDTEINEFVMDLREKQ